MRRKRLQNSNRNGIIDLLKNIQVCISQLLGLLITHFVSSLQYNHKIKLKIYNLEGLSEDEEDKSENEKSDEEEKKKVISDDDDDEPKKDFKSDLKFKGPSFVKPGVKPSAPKDPEFLNQLNSDSDEEPNDSKNKSVNKKPGIVALNKGSKIKSLPKSSDESDEEDKKADKNKSVMASKVSLMKSIYLLCQS